MKPGALERARQWARTLSRDVVALYLAGRDPRVPWLREGYRSSGGGVRPEPWMTS
jgi:uncharacterized membrane protein YkvA (DUF1232 family)